MKEFHFSEKWAILAALRQGEWVSLGKWGAIAASETMKSMSVSPLRMLLPAVLFPQRDPSRLIGGSHYLVSPSLEENPSIYNDPQTLFDPDSWKIMPFLPSEEKPLATALSLVKEAALLPALIIDSGNPEKGVIHIPEEAFSELTHRHRNWMIAARAIIPVRHGQAELIAFRPDDGGPEQVALVFGKPTDNPLVRLHSECLTGDVFGSQRCDCGEQLNGAMQRLSEARQGGILLYLAQEGRGIGLVNKLRAYQLQDKGLDTFDANLRLGFGADERTYEAAAAMLKTLGFRKIDLLSNNPEKAKALMLHDIHVSMVSHAFPPNRHNESYLAAKSNRFKHLV